MLINKIGVCEAQNAIVICFRFYCISKSQTSVNDVSFIADSKEIEIQKEWIIYISCQNFL